MADTDGSIQVDIDGAGKKVATAVTTIAAQQVHVQYVAEFASDLPHGYSVAHIVAVSGTNEQVIKASPGQVYGYRAYNRAGYQLFVKLHNTAVTPTPGLGVVQTIGLQATLSDKDFYPAGTAFSVGIGLTITANLPDSDTTGVAADDCVIDLFYK